jgi:hypothetical protein
MVAWFDQRGTAVVERRSSRGHRQGGLGSSQRQCGAQGGDGEFRGGPGRHFPVAQRWRHDGAMAAMGGRGGKGCSTRGEGAPFNGRTRRWPRVTETVGGSGRRSRGQTRRQPRSEHGRHGGAVVRTVWLMGGSTQFYNFLNYPNWLKLGN